MSDTQTLVLISVLRDTVLLAVFLWLPVMNKERAFFGVRVAPELYRGEGRRTLYRYWLMLVGIFVLFEAVGFSLFLRFNNPLLSALASLVATGAAFAIYSIYARAVYPHAIPSEATRFASSIQARSLQDYTHWWLELTLAGITIAAFAICAFYYPQIPAVMPVHWNLAGTPNRWEQKSLAAVFFLPALGLYLQMFFLVLKHDLAHARMTLPGEHTAEFLRGKERYLLMNILLVDWARIAVALLFLIISLLIISTTVNELNRFTRMVNLAIWVILAAMLGGFCYFIRRMKRINDELKAKFGESYVQRPADEQHWLQGGLAYYNPDDTALVVEKLVGFGYTLNLAHPRIPSRLALLAGVPIFVAWALLSF
jgi:uncharacterized membrane protein